MKIDINKNINIDIKIKRPLLCVGLTLFFSIMIASFLSFNVNVALVFIIFVVFFAILFFKLKQDRNTNRLKLILVLLLTASFGIFYYIKKNNFEFEKLLSLSDKEIIIDATIISYPEYAENSTVYDVKLNNIAGFKNFNNLKLKLYLKESAGVEPYDRFLGKVRCFSQYLDSPDNLKKYYKYSSQPISFFAYSSEKFDWEYQKSKTNVFYKFILDSRKYLKDNIIKVFNNNQSGLMIGMLLGDKTNINYLTKRIFSLSGISHLLAVSGLHISILLQTVYRLFDFLKFKKRNSAIFIIVFTVFFVALTGFSPSAIRAGIMNVICVLGSLLNRESDSLNSLGISLIFILLYNPFLALDIGLQLSFIATLGIILFQDKIYKRICGFVFKFKYKKNNKLDKIYRYICSSISVSIAALILTIPIMIVNFGQISIIAPVTNVLLTPIIAPTLIFISVTAILGGFSFLEWIYKFFALLSSIGTNIIKGIATMMAQIPFASISVNKKYVYIWLISVLVLTLIYKYILKSQKIKKYVYLYSVIILLVGKLSNDIFVFGYVNFKDIGEDKKNYIIADTKTSVVVLTQNEKYLLQNIDDNIKLLGINHLDTIVLSSDINVLEAIKIISVYKPYKIISSQKMIDLIKNNLFKNSLKLVRQNDKDYILQKDVFSKKMTELVVFDQRKILISNKSKKLKVF